MVAMETPVCDFGWRAPDFALKGVDGRTHRLGDIAGEKGTLVVFMCNHCPYVKAILDRIVRDAADLKAYGINTVAIMPNDTDAYPDDSFDNMKALAAQKNFPFPYLLDETQQTARAYNAVCTPDFYGFDADLGLQYRGRLDESRRDTAPEGAKRDLFEAMKRVAETGRGPDTQIPSIGCSIKWRNED
jgi:peroxiredoxin